VSYTITPTYRAFAIYAPVSATQQSGISSLLRGQLGGVASLAGVSFPGGADLQRLAALIQARAITIKALRGENALPELFPKRWDPATQQWKRPSQSFSLFSTPQPTNVNKDGSPSDQEILEAFEGVRLVGADPATNLITVQVTLRDPELAARLADHLARYVNEYERARASVEAARAISFVNQQLNTTSQSTLRESLTELLDNELQKATLVKAREDFIVEVVDPAIVPERKIAPQRSTFVLFGFLFGGGLALLAALYFYRREQLGNPAKFDVFDIKGIFGRMRGS